MAKTKAKTKTGPGQYTIEGGKVRFATFDKQEWRMRAPTKDEIANALSAYRITFETVMNDDRLRELADDNEATLKREARLRAAAAQSVYLVPLLLENEAGQSAFDITDPNSMASFEQTEPAILNQWIQILWGPLQAALMQSIKPEGEGQTNGQ